MEIKKINSSEVDLVTELFDKYRVFYKQASDMELAHNFIRERLDKNESIIFVAIVQNNGKRIPIGFTQLYPKYSSVRTTQNWILNDLFVEKNYRKQGIGESLIRRAMEFARQSGSRFVELSTAVENFAAQRLYNNIGFKKQEPDSEFFKYTIDLN